MECGCQAVVFMISFNVAPPGRFNNSRILAVLLPRRAAPPSLRLSAAFLLGLALRAGIAFCGATAGRRRAGRAFLAVFFESLSVCCSGIRVVMIVISPFAA